MDEGLLGKISRGVRGLLSNEHLQGAAGAAAFGASPLLGLLAGGTIKSGRERRERRNELERREVSARRRLPELLAERTTVEAPGAGLLNLDGSVDELPGKRQSVQTVSTQAGNAELMGLLTDIAPQTAVQGLLSSQNQQPRSAPAVVRVADELGLTGEDRDKFIRDNFNPNASTETQQAQIDLMRAMLEFQEAKDGRSKRQAEESVERAEFGNSVNTTIDNLFQLAEVNRELAGTGQAPGFGASARSSIGSAVAFGADAIGADEFASEVQGNVDLAQRFDTLANEILIDSLNTGNFDARTDTKFRQFSSTKPTREGMGSRANDLAIADKFDAVLLAADANGLELSPERRQQIMQESKRLRESTLPPRQLLQMSLEDIMALDPDDTDRYTEEQKAALTIRIRQLRQ